MNVNYILLDQQVLEHWFCSTETSTLEEAKLDPDKVWSRFFKLDTIRSLRKRWTFNFTISSDAVGVTLHFTRRISKQQPSDHEPVRDMQVLEPGDLQPGLYHEKHVLERFRGYSPEFNFWAIDPGVRNVLSAVNLTTGEALPVTQKEYVHEIQGKWPRLTKLTRELQGQKRSWQQEMRIYPWKKTVLQAEFDTYLSLVSDHWKSNWQLAMRRRYRHSRFERNKHKQQFTDGTVKKFKAKATENDILIFGAGGSGHGGFMSVRGGGPKGPVKHLKSALSKHFIVITASEFRTSRCCVTCGQPLQHPHCMKKHPRRTPRKRKPRLKRNALPELAESSVDAASPTYQKVEQAQQDQQSRKNFAVSYCSATGCDSGGAFVDRDRDAARKIGLRFLAQLCEASLGAWSFSVKSDALEEKEWPELTNFAIAKSLYLPIGRQAPLEEVG
jgi:hypothetical protein